MRETSLARRYALGYIKTIKDEQEYIQIKAELAEFLKLLHINREFKAGMETQLFSRNQKEDLLESIHQEMGFSQKTFNFLSAMIEENRIILLDLVIQLLEDLWFEKNGIEKLKVFSAVPLNERQEKKLIARLEKSLNKKIMIEREIDESLIAGIKIQKGSIFYDFSLEGNLKKLKEAIISEAAVPGALAKEH